MKNLINALALISDSTVSNVNGAIVVNVVNPPLKVNEYSYTAPYAFTSEDYIVFKYSARSITRDHKTHAPFVVGVRDDGEDTLVELNYMIFDGKSHTVIAKTIPGVKYSSLKIRFPVKAPDAKLVIESIYTAEKNEIPARFSNLATDTALDGFETVSIKGAYNGSIDDMPTLPTDSGRSLPDGKVNLLGIPFEFSEGELNEIVPPPPPVENDEFITNFGVPNSKRRLCRPISRDGITNISLSGKAREAIFALHLSKDAYERWGFCASDSTILGAGYGEVKMPLQAKDVERFMIEVTYEDGTHSTAFPYNLSTKSYVLSGEVGLYAIPLEAKALKDVKVHNRIIDADVSVLALTLNKSSVSLIPSSKKPRICEPKFSKIDKIVIDSSIVKISSGAISMVIDTSSGLNVTTIENGYVTDFKATGSLLKLRRKDGEIIQNFETKIVKSSSESVTFCASFEGVTYTVTASIAPKSTVTLSLTAKNCTDEEVSHGIIFPAIDNLSFADFEDGWYMFPKYQNSIGNGRIYVYEESAPSFPMQFFDLFSKSQRGGIGLLTKERGVQVRKYALHKTDDGMSAFVEYPDMYMKIKPGEEFTASPTELFVHSGDWHEAFNRYKAWLDTWYVPYKSQNKSWYRKLFWLVAEITDFYENYTFVKRPIWYHKHNGKYNFQMIMDEQKSIYGCYPDILHMWAWCCDDKARNRWGHYNDEDYECVGGLEPFKRALADCHDKTNAEISLYMHPTLLSDCYPEFKIYAPDYLVKNVDGNYLTLESKNREIVSYRMCHANETWRNYAINMYRRVCEETEIKIIYVDEFSLRTENRCYVDSHGHETPSNLIKTDRDFISKLREVIPEDIVLYGEYAAVDVNARYIDCNISYHILDSVRDMIESSWIEGDDVSCANRSFTDLYRFAFPGIVQLVLPMAMRNLSWQPLKSTFFNGEAIYDSFWDAEESRGVEFMAKAFRIKKKYGDNFASDNPKTMIETPLQDVYANEFPSKNGTLYTLYSQAYSTRSGTLLEVEHVPGTTYYDVWNDKPLDAIIEGTKAKLLGSIDAGEVGCIYAKSANYFFNSAAP